jgi:hypothetical protein
MVFIFIVENAARGHSLFSIGFMRQGITIEISKDFVLTERIFAQERVLKC